VSKEQVDEKRTSAGGEGVEEYEEWSMLGLVNNFFVNAYDKYAISI